MDDRGNLLTSHACHGGLVRPGDATLARTGDNVVVTNFVSNDLDHVPVCAGRLHGPPHWREATLRGGDLGEGVGGVYFRRFGGVDGGAEQTTIHALDDNLQPTGPAPPATDPVDYAPCTGLTGTSRQHTEELAGQLVVFMGACCGDEGGGLFVCRPPGRGP